MHKQSQQHPRFFKLFTQHRPQKCKVNQLHKLSEIYQLSAVHNFKTLTWLNQLLQIHKANFRRHWNLGDSESLKQTKAKDIVSSCCSNPFCFLNKTVLNFGQKKAWDSGAIGPQRRRSPGQKTHKFRHSIQTVTAEIRGSSWWAE